MFGPPGISRRDWLQLSSAGLAASVAAPWFNVLAARAGERVNAGVRSKSCILVWMQGGPPQSLTFDVKSHSAFKSMATVVPGIRISEHLPKTASVMQDISLLRSME